LNAFSLFFCFPLLSCYSFSLPYSNLLILLFSSLPIQSACIFYKVGLFIGCIEQLGQTISCGIVFLVLQIKEFFYSFVSISDCIFGSIFYFTTGLHGMHVIFGLLYFFSVLVLYFILYYLSYYFILFDYLSLLFIILILLFNLVYFFI